MGNYYLYQIASFIARIIPLRMAYALAVRIADLHYLFSRTDRKAVEANLKVILGTDPVPPAMARQVFRNFGKYLADFFTMTKYLNADFIKTRVQVRDSGYLNEALSGGKGCVLVGAHLGSWELVGGVLSLLGYPLSVIALPHNDPKVNKFFNDQRAFFGVTVIPSTAAIRRCMEQLNANRCVGILAERDFSQQGMVMDFLGRPTMIPRGAALFSLKTGAPIVHVFMVRDGNDGFHITFERPIYPSSGADGKITDEDLKFLIGQYIKNIEAQIRRHPTQWLMFREFWAS
ncbi:MAG: lysophospholipid acyltransferase family protein [Candidatus Omnitrophica bacterium]|nr:lysophospholipid acyltransferase family protein [Candidatus Omnitrophota bacterium]